MGGSEQKITEGRIKICEILFKASSTQIVNHKTNNKQQQQKTSKQLSKEAIRQGKLRQNYKMFSNPVFIIPGRYNNNNNNNNNNFVKC